jgi:hypothetical protein
MLPRPHPSLWRHLIPALAVLALAAPALGAVPLSSLGPELLVNEVTAGYQFSPAVASDAQGRSLVVWLDEFRNGVFAQRFDAAGQRAGREFRVDDDLSFSERPIQQPPSMHPFFGPRVASGRDGGFLVVWPTSQGVRARLYDAAGASRTGSLHVTENGFNEVDVAARPGGGYVLVWIEAENGQGLILRRFYDAQGIAEGGLFQVDQAPSPGPGLNLRWPRLAMGADGRFIVTWERGREAFVGSTAIPESDIWARRFNAAGQPLGDEFRVNRGVDEEQYGAMPVIHPDGGFSVVWNNVVQVGAGFEIQAVAQRFDGAGARLGAPVRLSSQGSDLAPPVVAAGPDGNPVVLWPALGPRDPGIAVVGRVFNSHWQPLSEIFQVNTYTEFHQTNPDLAVDALGRFFAVWVSGEPPAPRSPPPVEFEGQDGSSYGVYAQRFTVATCQADTTGLCLNNGRFRVEVVWTDPRTHNTGAGKAIPRTADTGLFWFFDPSNVELIVKILDGRSVNGHFWVFYGSLTDVEFVLTVTDTVTGERETYHNPPYHMASMADTAAFTPEPRSTASRLSAADVLGETGPGPFPETPPATAEESLLHLSSGRFIAEVAWTDPRTGNSGTGRAVPLTGDTGAFWFFSATNLELVIKVLDGRPVNGAFWVFYGSLSDVEYTLTVTDTVTGARRQYHNPPFTLASRADTNAFRATSAFQFPERSPR